MHPRTTTTTESFSWQWPCGTACKMERQVTISCPPNGCRCCWHGIPTPSAAGHHRHTHHQRQEYQYALQGGTTWALAAEESKPPAASAAAGRRTPLHASVAAEESNNNNPPAAADRRTLLYNPPVAAAEFWVPDPHLMVQQLREFESLNDEAVALRAQLQEYMADIDRSREEDNAGWFLALPENVRHVLVVARDAINSYSCIAMSAPRGPARPAK